MSSFDGNFIDRCKLHLKAGDGGRGIVSFRHEKYVPMGGPDGGDGGKGGSIIFQVHDGMNTLEKVSSQPLIRAEKGTDGGKNNRTGANGEDIVIQVPAGTVVKDFETGELIMDMEDTDGEWIAAQGGDGGKGNTRFATPTNQAPRKATPGFPGDEKILLLELKLVAQVGLIGLPNAGKSTLISKITGARPKIANYPFTTLQPVLGTLPLEDGFGIVIADIPGIIQGAHEGIGLGLDFLRHIERTKMLVFVIEISPHDPNTPAQTFMELQHEIAQYDASILDRTALVVLNKFDLLDDETEQELVIQTFREQCTQVTDHNFFTISALNSDGTAQLRQAIIDQYTKLFPEEFVLKQTQDTIRPSYMDDQSLFEDNDDSKH